MEKETTHLVSLLAGSVAGISADIALFPIDSIKTRAQSQLGFWKSGGFKGLYRGIGSAAMGSAPSGASFFLAYDATKAYTSGLFSSPVCSHMAAAVSAETFSCIFRIPFEVVKQTAQTNGGMNSLHSLRMILKDEGVRGLGRGYWSMISREIPFTLIQFPLWEHLKSFSSGDAPCSPLNSAIYGSFAGGTAAALTTPFDVAKTRIILMQSKGVSENNPFKVVYSIGRNEGIQGLFAGIIPRVVWISVGGFIFLGAYEKSKTTFTSYGL